MLHFALSLFAIIAQFHLDQSTGLQCVLSKPGEPIPALATALDTSIQRYEAEGWTLYHRCRRGSTVAVVLLNAARARHLKRGDAPGPPSNLIIASRSSGAHEELTTESRFVASSGDVGACTITNVWRPLVLYECAGGDGPASWRALHALHW